MGVHLPPLFNVDGDLHYICNTMQRSFIRTNAVWFALGSLFNDDEGAETDIWT